MRKKDDKNKVTGKDEKREAEEKIFRCSEEGYGGSWCKGDRRWKQDAVEEYHTRWQSLIEGKGRKKKKNFHASKM